MAPVRQVGGRDVFPVGLGCMNITHAYGPPMDEGAAKALLVRALDLGYDFLDTATLYGFGRSEELIGEALRDRRSEYLLASKCVLGFKDGQRTLDARPESIKAACEASLKRLQTDVIDLYYMHRPDPNVPIEDSVGALADLVQEGKIRMIGLSEMGEADLRRAHAVHPIAAMQSEYSLWVRMPGAGRGTGGLFSRWAGLSGRPAGRSGQVPRIGFARLDLSTLLPGKLCREFAIAGRCARMCRRCGVQRRSTRARLDVGKGRPCGSNTGHDELAASRGELAGRAN